MVGKYTIEFVLNWCNDNNIECLETEFISVKTPMRFKCTNCGDVFLRNFENLKTRKKTLCNKCSAKDRGKYRRLEISEVEDYIESKGCKLVSSYKNMKEDIEIICSCGNKFKTSYYQFRKNNHIYCIPCSRNIMSEKKAIPIEDLQFLVSQEGSTFIKRELKGKDQLICVNDNCGHKDYWVRLNKFKYGQRCPLCSISKGERVIYNFLKNNKFNFKREYTFKDLKGINDGILRFDFAVFKNNKLHCLIEYDGLQHYEVCFNSEYNFKRTQSHDKLKNKYCQDNNIKLIRIPYYRYKDIEIILKNYI